MSRSAVLDATVVLPTLVHKDKRSTPKLIPSGELLGRLVATSEYELRTRSDGRNRCYQKFECSCGNSVLLAPFSVSNGNTSSCGCAHSEGVSTRMTIHGKSKTSEYRVNLNRQRRGLKKSTEVCPVSLDDLSVLLSEYGNQCWICDGILTDVTWDHFQPLTKGGSHTVDNLRPACKSCNSKKSNRWPFTDEMKMKIAEEVRASRTFQGSTFPVTDSEEVR